MTEVIIVKISTNALLITSLVTTMVLVTSAKTNQGTNHLTTSAHSNSMVSEGIELSASSEKDLVNSNEPMVLKLSLKNPGRKSLFVYKSSDETDYKLTVKDEKGGSVPLTEYGKQVLSSADEFRRVRVEVKPGEEMQDSIPVSKLYQVAVGGTYFIIARRQFFRRSSRRTAEVMSNEVTIRVINEPAP